MSFKAEWFRRIRYLLNRRRLDEARSDREAHAPTISNPSPFGNTPRAREAGDVWTWTWLGNLVHDTRFAGRTLRRTAGFTAVVVSSLGVGFALTASTIAVANAYLIRSLPYAGADRLYHVMYAPPGPWEPRGMSSLDWSSVADVVEFPITASGEMFYLAEPGYSQSLRGLRVTGSFVDGLGVRAVVGRPLGDRDFGGTAETPALIGYAIWRDRYGSDPGVIGRLLRADPESASARTDTFRIVGVLEPEFYYGRDSSQAVDLLLPLTAPARTYMVRLRQGVPRELAERRITEAARQVATGLPADWPGVQLESARERYVGQLRPVLAGITLATGLVLVIVCANVAVLTLLRAIRRQKEIAVRAALGAARRHLARMLATEGALLCLAGLAIGVGLTHGLLGVLGPLIEMQLGRPAPGGTAAIAIDGTVLLILGAIGVAVAVSLSLVQLLSPWQHRLVAALRGDGPMGGDGRLMRRVRSGLVAVEVAGTLILLVACGLLVRSVVGMLRTDLGFDVERLVRARVILRASDYTDPAGFYRFYERFTERLASAIRSPVVFASWPPFIELPKQSIEVNDRAGQAAGAGVISVGGGYFNAVGVSLRSGRDFTAADVAGAEPVAVVSETLARRLWPEGSAVGRRLRNVEPTPAGPRPGPWRVVIGVAADVRQTYGDTELSDLYLPLAPASFGRFGSFYVRIDRSTPALLETVRATAADLDPRATIVAPRPVASEDRRLAGTAFLTSMASGFAAIAAFIALLGIYGVSAYAVQQREREIAIRMALGAAAGAVVRLFLKEGALVLASGLAAGLIGAIAATRALESQLYAVRAFDPSTLGVACVVMASAGALATSWPARRASLRSPITALKES